MQNPEQKINSVVETVKVSKIIDALFSFRKPEYVSKDKASEKYQELKQSIDKAGLMIPITLAPHQQHEGRYVLIDGKRRLDAVIELGHKQIDAVILNGRTDLDLIITAIDQNLHRLNLDEIERIEVVLKAFKAVGHAIDSKEELISLGKAATRLSKAHYEGKKPTGEDKQLVDLIGKLGISLGYVSDMLSWKTELSEEVFNKAIEYEVPTDWRTALTRHPLNVKRNAKNQLAAFNEVVSMIESKRPREKIKAVIDAYVRDLKDRDRKEAETGQKIIWKSEQIPDDQKVFINLPADNGGKTIDPEEQPHLARARNFINTPPEVVKGSDPLADYMHLNIAINNFLKASTGYKAEDVNYREETIIGTENFRKQLVASILPQDLHRLRGRLGIMRDVIDSLFKLSDKRLDTKCIKNRLDERTKEDLK